jgi:hypothetical protein
MDYLLINIITNVLINNKYNVYFILKQTLINKNFYDSIKINKYFERLISAEKLKIVLSNFNVSNCFFFDSLTLKNYFLRFVNSFYNIGCNHKFLDYADIYYNRNLYEYSSDKLNVLKNLRLFKYFDIKMAINNSLNLSLALNNADKPLFINKLRIYDYF